MFNPAALSGVNADRYYTHLGQQDGYYTRSEEPPGKWLGRGAEALGLTGERPTDSLACRQRAKLGAGRVDPRDFKDLLNGTFRGQKLHAGTQPGGTRLKAYDCPIAPPKSVSAAYAVGSPETRAAIWRAQARAEEAVIRRLEATVVCRSGAGGKNKEQGAGLIVGVFRHDNNRAGEPSLHSHMVVMNLARRADGKFCSPSFREMLREQKAIGAFYRATVARELAREGFAIKAVQGRDENGRSYQSFELRDVPPQLTAAFSKRSAEIKAAAEEKGISRATENRRTRAKKEPVVRAELDAKWLATARAAGFEKSDFRVVAAAGAAIDQHAPGEIKKMEVSGLPKAEREAHFERKDAEKAGRSAGGEATAGGGEAWWRDDKPAASAAISPEKAAAASRGAAAIMAALKAKSGAKPRQVEGVERSLERRFEADDA
jgi:conjugative relaxase-like TrwC/TraI family protein